VNVPADDHGHQDLFAAAPRATPWVIVALIGAGLALDAKFGWPGQVLTTALTCAAWVWLYRASGAGEQRVLLLCTLISGVGEVFLSLVWGLYDYQFHNVPLFVPPGHALLMALGLIFMRHVGMRAVALISGCAAAWAAYAAWAGFDRFGVALLPLYLLCVAFGPAKRLYATMFVLALAMELYGTALGNWRWAPLAPWLGLTQANPPFSAGAFYCALDLLVLATLRLANAQGPHREANAG
jgi:hypothetical protein